MNDIFYILYIMYIKNSLYENQCFILNWKCAGYFDSRIINYRLSVIIDLRPMINCEYSAAEFRPSHLVNWVIRENLNWACIQDMRRLIRLCWWHMDHMIWNMVWLVTFWWQNIICLNKIEMIFTFIKIYKIEWNQSFAFRTLFGSNSVCRF